MEFLTEAQRLREELNDLGEAFEELEKENEHLSNSNDWYEEKLSEFMDGLPIEKADKSKTYYFNLMGDWKFIEWCEATDQWLTSGCYMCSDEEIPSEDLTVYPLPSETKEGS